MGVAVMGQSRYSHSSGESVVSTAGGEWLFFRDRLNRGDIFLVVLLTHLISKFAMYFCKILSLRNTYKNQHINNNTCIYNNLTNVTHCGTL